jgi:hypothetical protein
MITKRNLLPSNWSTKNYSTKQVKLTTMTTLNVIKSTMTLMTANKKEINVTYSHYDLNLIPAVIGAPQPIYLVTVYVDGSGSLEWVQQAIAKFLEQLPAKIRAKMKGEKGISESLQGRVLVGFFSFSTAHSGEEMTNVRQLTPYMPLDQLTSVDWAQAYKADGGTPLVDAFFLSSRIAMHLAKQLAKRRIQTFAINVLLTDGGDSDYSEDAITDERYRANYYANPEFAKEALDAIKAEGKAFKSGLVVVIGVGEWSAKTAINYINQQVGINEWLDAGNLSEEKVEEISNYLVDYLVFNASIAFLPGAARLALPAAKGDIKYYAEQ